MNGEEGRVCVHEGSGQRATPHVYITSTTFHTHHTSHAHVHSPPYIQKEVATCMCSDMALSARTK